jgi:hypothetical protein
MSLEGRFVDLTCRGLRVAQKARLTPESESAGFVELEAPLPIGTRVQLTGDGDFRVEARVVKVVEQEAGAKSPPGMRLDWSVVTVVTPPPPVAEEIEAAEEDAEASTPAASEGPAPTDGRRRRGRQAKKTMIGR